MHAAPGTVVAKSAATKRSTPPLPDGLAMDVAILLGCAFVIDRLGRRRWTSVCFVDGATLLAALGSLASGSVVAVITLVTLSYGIVGSVNAVLYLYTPEIYPTRMRALPPTTW